MSSGFRSFGKRSMFKKRAQSEDMALQITSMADIFTILLVFLLKSYTAGAMSINPSQGTTLPQGRGSEAAFDALKVEVSSSAVLIEGQSVAPLQQFKFESADLQANGTSTTLAKAFERERQKQLLIAKSNTEVKVDSKIIVIADQKVPYQTLKSVLSSAAVHGYTDFKLAVARGD